MAFRTNKTPVLQEKSASGSVASFNTALAMPLVNGEFSIEAYQEGTGDPSPVNVRNIVPFNTQKIIKAGKNLLDKNLLIQSPAVNQPYLCKLGADSFYSNIPNGSIVLASGQYTFSCIYKNDSSKNNTQLSVYDENGNNLYTRNTVQSIKFTVPKSMAVCFYLNCGASGFTSWDDYDIQLEVGSQATDYEQYNGETVTVALGEDVYGGSYNSVSGKKRKTHNLITLDGSSDENWVNYSAGNGYYIQIADMESLNNGEVMSNYLPQYSGINNLGIRLGFNNNYAYMYQVNTLEGVTDLESWRAYLQNNPLTFVYPLAEPIESNIGATPIETYDGVNNIFCDTGDIDLTYKDLDIAKRGNFREVFKLPS